MNNRTKKHYTNTKRGNKIILNKIGSILLIISRTSPINQKNVILGNHSVHTNQFTNGKGHNITNHKSWRNNNRVYRDAR